VNRRFLNVVFLPLCIFLLGQRTVENGEYATQWAKRHAQYLSDPIINLKQSELEITADSPRPLDGIVAALAKRNGWHINYEDPVYGDDDVIDDTAPSWLEDHPNGPRGYGIAGSAFHTKIQINGQLRDQSEQVLSTLIADYNQSNNPGRFELQNAHGQLDVVPTGTARGRQVPLLDTEMSFDEPGVATASVTLERFCDELSRQSGHKVVFLAPPSANVLHQTHIKQHSQKQSAREILRQLYEQIGSKFSWRLLYDPDTREFWLTMEW
jgi:hypothetical protein